MNVTCLIRSSTDNKHQQLVNDEDDWWCSAGSAAFCKCSVSACLAHIFSSPWCIGFIIAWASERAQWLLFVTCVTDMLLPTLHPCVRDKDWWCILVNLLCLKLRAQHVLFWVLGLLHQRKWKYGVLEIQRYMGYVCLCLVDLFWAIWPPFQYVIEFRS